MMTFGRRMACSLSWLAALALPGLVPAAASGAAAPPPPAGREAVLREWQHPSRTYKPRVRWGWPGNNITPAGIDADLHALAAQGIGGVEIVTYWQVFQQGNVAPLSPRWFELVRHALATARELDMDVALTFTEAGWSFGGNWVPPADRSKVLVQSWVDVSGPAEFAGPLPRYQVPPVDPVTPPVEPWRPNPAPDEQAIVAVVAGRVTPDGGLDGDSLTVLPAPVEGKGFSWAVPPGTWRLMVFQSKYTGQINQAQNFEPPPWMVDTLNPDAMRRFIETLGGRLHAALGDEFGRTLDSLYCDSFEVKPIEDSVLWSQRVLADFAAEFGYDFTTWLPAIWWDIGARTPRLRHDLNTFLHRRSLDGLLRPFVEWCESHGVDARVEPVDTFPGEVIESAGRCSRPETEKSMQIFAVSTYPRKCEAAGLRFYGHGSVLSAEAFTVLNPQRYRASLEDMKIAADGFLRDGVTQFYGHGYWHTPEAEIVPSRDFPWATRISPANTWWPHFASFNHYLTRCAVLLRQGEFCGDLLVYSPQDDLWSEKGVWGGNWRTVPFARLGTTLVANGYDFDPVNNDVLLHRARVEGSFLAIGAQRYRAVILPDIEFMPPEALAVLDAYVRAGGTVIALNGLPDRAPGMRDWERRDRALRELVADLFGPAGNGRTFPGGGATFRVNGYPMDEEQEKPYIRDDELFRPQPPLAGGRAELIRRLRSRVDPDFALPGDRQSNGLTFLHRRAGDLDLYFVTNLEAEDFAGPIRFRVHGKSAELWDPETGVVTPAVVGRERKNGTDVWLTLDSLETCFVVFKPGEPGVRVIASDLPRLRSDGATGVIAEGAHPGRYAVTFEAGGRTQVRTFVVEKLPSEVPLDTGWTVDFGSAAGTLSRGELTGPLLEERGPHASVVRGVSTHQLDHLASWTADPATRHFSGTATYTRTLHWEPGAAPSDVSWELDLGAVGDIAELQVNDQPAGVRWKRPYRFDVTTLLQPGRNELRVRVTNRLINRIAGMTETPPIAPDIARITGPARPLAPRVPDTFDSDANCRDWGIIGKYLAEKERGFNPLPDSGLLGPVRLIAVQRLPMVPDVPPNSPPPPAPGHP